MATRAHVALAKQLAQSTAGRDAQPVLLLQEQRVSTSVGVPRREATRACVAAVTEQREVTLVGFERGRPTHRNFASTATTARVA